MTWPWFHHLPLCTFLTSLQAGCSLHTQRILPILPLIHSFHVKCSFHRQSHVSFPYFIQISAQMSPAQEAFSDSPTLRANSPTSSISLPFPSSLVVIELISLTHVQLNIITFTYSCIDCIPHSEVDRQGGLCLSHTVLCFQKRRIRQEVPVLRPVVRLQLSLYKDLGKKSKDCLFFLLWFMK